jgi:hypothetical protein
MYNSELLRSGLFSLWCCGVCSETALLDDLVLEDLLCLDERLFL